MQYYLEHVIDSFKHKGLRKNLIQTLRDKGIEDEQVLTVMNKIPRHFFIDDNAFLHYAYKDEAFPIGASQTISHPFTVAFQSSLLEIKKRDKVLEIGTGSGYQTAVLLELGARVYSIERQRTLFLKTKPLLSKLGYNAKLFYGDGYKGSPSFAPFDKIIVTAGAPYIPDALKDQLAVGGIMVIPVDINETTQVMNRLIKQPDGSFETTEYGEFKFVPLLENKSPKG